METFTNEQLIKMYTPLIYKIAAKFYNVDKEDLFQEGAQVISIAYQNYHKDGNTKFSTYVYPYIYGAMYSFVNQKNQPIKISKDVLSEYKKIEKTRYKLAQIWHRIPNYDEVAIYLEMDIALVNQIVSSASTIMMSMDEDRETSRTAYETISMPESLSWDDKIMLQESLGVLSPEERQIVEYRYFDDLTQSEVARRLNKTQVMISRYEKKSLEKMHEFLSN